MILSHNFHSRIYISESSLLSNIRFYLNGCYAGSTNASICRECPAGAYSSAIGDTKNNGSCWISPHWLSKLFYEVGKQFLIELTNLNKPCTTVNSKMSSLMTEVTDSKAEEHAKYLIEACWFSSWSFLYDANYAIPWIIVSKPKPLKKGVNLFVWCTRGTR
jgi:hypothetical protein